MKQDSELKLEPFWQFTSRFWISCSKCDFVFLIPLVAMVGKKKDAPKSIRFVEPKGMLGQLKSLFGSKKDSGDRIFGFMWPRSKFCKKCKSVYISKLDKSIKLKEKYWEGLNNSEAEFLSYLREHTTDFNSFKKEKCTCGESLIILNKCPKCNSPLKISEREVDGFPIMKG
jgi:hypothetical protein